MLKTKSIARHSHMVVGVSKKTEKLIKLRKPKNNNRKNQTVKKNRLNKLELKKKPTGSV